MWVTIPEGEMGDCARCSKAPAVQGVNQQLLWLELGYALLKPEEEERAE